MPSGWPLIGVIVHVLLWIKLEAPFRVHYDCTLPMASEFQFFAFIMPKYVVVTCVKSYVCGI
jgi:hypothetical protein